MIELGRGDLGQQLARLDVVADIDLALVDVAAGAGKDIGGGEGRRGGRQADRHRAGARACTVATRTFGTKSRRCSAVAITSLLRCSAARRRMPRPPASSSEHAEPEQPPSHAPRRGRPCSPVSA